MSMSKKVYKSISYIERVNNPLLASNVKFEHTDHYVLSPKSNFDATLQRSVVTTQFKVRPLNCLSKYKISDFSLDNLIACGALANARSVSYKNDTFTELNNISSQLDNIVNSK